MRHRTFDVPASVELGYNPATHTFRLVAPGAAAAWLVWRRHPADAASERTVRMPRVAAGGVFACGCPDAAGRFYRYRVQSAGATHDVADPRSTAVARQYALGHATWSVAQPVATFDWRGDCRPGVDVRAAVLYELHVGDFTAHASAGSRYPGTWRGAYDLEPRAPGGLHALRDLGVNAIELLPQAAWPELEPMPGDPGVIAGQGNPTGRNHWGYMPSYLMAPTHRFSVHGVRPLAGAWVGVDDDGTYRDPAPELQAFVRECHAAGIAVVVDAVFNHVSIHDDQPLLQLDPGDWFHREPDGRLRSQSGCGNDLDTRNPTMHRLVVDAARHWMRTFHLDGLRLDLAALIDDATLSAIGAVVRAEAPCGLMISEPWGLGSYRPEAIAGLGHSVWNDRFRNGVKGHHPVHGRGYGLGRWEGGASRRDVAALLLGWVRGAGGTFDAAHLSINYLESHDNYTVGDFVRLALGEVEEGVPVQRADVARLSPPALRVHLLLATALLAARGTPMLAAGQEWGRAKVQASDAAQAGPLDGNSYNRTDATNQLDWRDRERNLELVERVRRLVAFRKEWLAPAFALHAAVDALGGSRDLALGYRVPTPRGDVAVLLNADPTESAWFDLAGGPWFRLIGADAATIVPTEGGVAVEVAPVGAAVLVLA
ncbi:MAG: hypothetical protein EXR79_15825 [Myxococcales bacterium]|nr:hypothetical protein [Myxococcales bacterium]